MRCQIPVITVQEETDAASARPLDLHKEHKEVIKACAQPARLELFLPLSPSWSCDCGVDWEESAHKQLLLLLLFLRDYCELLPQMINPDPPV